MVDFASKMRRLACLGLISNTRHSPELKICRYVLQRYLTETVYGISKIIFQLQKNRFWKFWDFFWDFSIFGGCQWFPIVISIGFGEIWTKIRQNPENFRKINLSRPPEGVGRRAWPFLNATCRGESISEVYVAIWKHLEHENLKKHDFHDFLQKFEKSTLLLLWPPL